MKIDEQIAESFEIDIDVMFERNKIQPGAIARQFGMWYRKTHLEQSNKQIKQHYNKNHGTVNHAIRTIQNFIDTNRNFRQQTESILEKLNG